MITSRLSRALSLAIKAHDADYRKGTTIPYISHPLGVAAIVLEYGGYEDQAIAALLHDAIEDGGIKYVGMIEAAFGTRVLALVEGCTDGVPDAQGRKADWYERKRNYLEHLRHAHDDVLLVSGADKLHNTRSIVYDLSSIGEIVFERFSTKKEGTLRYYSSLSAVFKDRLLTMSKAIEETVNELLKNANDP